MTDQPTTPPDNVLEFRGLSYLPMDPDRLLEQAKGKLERVAIIGVDLEGNEFLSISDPDGGTFLWDIERAKLKLLRLADK